MKYLVKKYLGKNSGSLAQSRYPRKVLYVADTHTFDLKGKQLISLTDLREYAQGFSIDEASAFIKTNKDFYIEEPEEDLMEDPSDE